ncbi:sensor histidine kinase [uncultured Algibacter sp.]|uniref:ATP-binding protein n=1 Tax=uncultured Algibacter sp. TaxID=298659 RepID=UPI002616F337|nr:sensor histidine kinase [uncultured Algibacter sp.]
MKKVLVVFVFLLSTSLLFCQTNIVIDSLEQILLVEKNQVKKCSLYNDLVRNYIYNKPKISLKYNDSLASLSKEINNDELQMLSLYNYSVVHRVLGDSEKALRLLMDYKESIEKKKDTFNLISTYYQIGVSYMGLDKKVEAVDFLLKSLELSELTNNKERALINQNALGAIYDQMGQYKKALNYYKKVEKSYLESNNLHDIGLIYNNIGVVYKHLDSLDLALNYFNKGYDLSKNSEDLIIKSFQLRNIGLIQHTQKKFALAEKNYLSALEIRKQMGEKLPLCGSYYDLGNFYLETANLSKAESNFDKALVLSREIKSRANQSKVLIGLSKVYENRGERGRAYTYYKKGKDLNDSIQSIVIKEKVNELDVKYQTEKKDKEIATQQLALKEQKSEIQKKKTQNNYMLGTVIFLLSIAVLLGFLFKQRQKRKNQELLTLKREFQIKTLESLIEGEEKERLRVAKELHDGVNGDLSAIKYKLSSLLEMNNTVIKEAITMIDDSCKQVRAISHNLVPPSLESFNLVEATDLYCANLNDVNPEIDLSFQHIGDTVVLTKKAEINVFRIIQELITNSLKHANASSINVQISCHNNNIQITVEDNGKGFNKEVITSDGIGLSNVQSRLDYLKAEVDFLSNKNGTSYTIDINNTELNDN